MKISALIEAMAEAGATMEVIRIAVVAMEECEDVSRPKSGAERSRLYRQRKRADVTPAPPQRDENVTPASRQRDENVTKTSRSEVPLACAFLTGEESSNIPPEKPSVSTPKGEKPTVTTDQPALPTPPPPAPPLPVPVVQPKINSRGSRLPADWEPAEASRQFAMAKLGSGNACREELEKFKEYFWSKAGADARKTDWDMTWKNWVRKAAEIIARNQSRVVPFANPYGTRNGKISLGQEGLRRVAELEASRRAREDLFGGASDEIRCLPVQLLPAG